MKVYIIDPVSYIQDGVSTGHYLAVAENLVEVFSSNHETMVAGGTIYVPKFKNSLLQLQRNTSDKYGKFRNKLNTLLNVRQVYREVQSDDILVWQSCSVLTVIIGILLFGKSNRKSFLIQYNARMVSNGVFRFLFSLVRKKITGIICTLDNVGQLLGLPYCVVPDYIYCKHQKESYLSFADREYDFSMVGMIRQEKGIIEVARKLSGTSYNVLIAGRPDNDEIREALLAIAATASNIHVKLEYVTEEQYDQYIRNSRYCVLNYQGEYSQRTSGVVYDVLFKGTPVVGNDCKGLSFIKENQVGYLFTNLEQWNPTEVLDAQVHAKFMESIQQYFLTHAHYQKKLNSFILK